MPRQRKTQTGAAAQPIDAVAGQMYGKGVEQQQLQETVPAPQVTNPAVGSPPQPAPTTTPAPAPSPYQPAPGPVDAMAAAAEMRNNVGLLNAPTQRPGEPVTTGLPSGLGAGPEALGMVTRSPLGETMRNLSNALGDPVFADLANRANI